MGKRTAFVCDLSLSVYDLLNFDCWDSKHRARNSVKIGPQRDIVGHWKHAANRYRLRFEVKEHFARSYSWFNTTLWIRRVRMLLNLFRINDRAKLIPKIQPLWFTFR
jgi:hypothetical protein